MHSSGFVCSEQSFTKVSGSTFSRFMKVCAVMSPNWPKFAHGDTPPEPFGLHNWPQRPYSHVVCFPCDSNPQNALVSVPTTLRNFREEICKENTSSNTSVTASLVPILEAHRQKVQILPCY